MIPILNSGLEPGRFEAGLRAYGERSRVMREALAAHVFDPFNAQDQEVERTRLALRAARAQLEQRFCLVLYGSGADDYTLRRAAAQNLSPTNKVEAKAATAAARDGERNAQRVSELMVLLEGVCGAQVALLERDAGADVPPGPIRLPTPDAIWFESFTWIAELAGVIVVVANTNENLVRELQYLQDVGLHRRALLYDGPELLWLGDRQRRWSLSVEALAQAFDFAAARDAVPRARA